MPKTIQQLSAHLCSNCIGSSQAHRLKSLSSKESKLIGGVNSRACWTLLSPSKLTRSFLIRHTSQTRTCRDAPTYRSTQFHPPLVHSLCSQNRHNQKMIWVTVLWEQGRRALDSYSKGYLPPLQFKIRSINSISNWLYPYPSHSPTSILNLRSRTFSNRRTSSSTTILHLYTRISKQNSEEMNENFA